MTTTEAPIPLAPGVPVLGSALDIGRDAMEFLVRAYRAHGPVFRVRVLNQRYTVLAGPELARWMGTAEGRAALSAHDAWQGLPDAWGADRIVLSTDGAEHRRLREVMRPGFSRDAVRERLDDLVAITDRRLERDWPPGTRVPLVRAIQDLVVDQLGTLLAGRAPAGRTDDLRRVARTILTTAVSRQRPAVLRRDPRYRRALERVRAFGTGLIADERRDHRSGPLVADSVAARDRDPGLMSEEDLVLAVVTPYIAGLDTVTGTLGFLVHAVLSRPAMLARIRAEAEAVFAAGPLTDASLAQLTATRGAVQETMRLWPVTVAQARTAAQDFTYAGRRIEAGEQVLCAVTVPHFLPEFFPDPQVFDIDRYGADRREHAAPGAYSPFGRGPHTCVGKGIADVQMTLTAARLFHRLDLAVDGPLRVSGVPIPGPSRRVRVRVNGVRFSGPER